MKFNAYFTYFTGRTVASITASLSSMVTALEAHAEAKLLEAEQHLKVTVQYQLLEGQARLEIDKAKAAAAKIAALFS